jgi:hypothetical protein
MAFEAYCRRAGNLQLEIGLAFPYASAALHTPDFADTLGRALLATRPIIQLAAAAPPTAKPRRTRAA